MSLKNQIESLLFSAGRKMHIEELAKLTKSKTDSVKKTIVELKHDYDDRNASLMLINEGDFWKIQVKELFLPLVKNIITETELPKTVMETLAVIAFKYPIKQSALIAIRTNKAYDHLKELESMGYITRQKHGRTNLIKLTQKFFEYFDLKEEQLKDKFKDFKSIAHAIESKEKEIDDIKEKQRAEAKQEKTIDQQEAAIQKEIADLEKYESSQSVAEVMEEENKLGSLDIVETETEEELDEDRQKISEVQQQDEVVQKQQQQEHAFEDEGIPLTNKLLEVIDSRVEQILQGEPQEKDEELPKPVAAGKEEEHEPVDLLEATMKAEQKQKDEEKRKRQK